MKYVFCGRDGSPIYENYRVKVDEDEQRRIKFMMTQAFRCQKGSELIPEYGFDLESVIGGEKYLRFAVLETLDNTDYYPGITSFVNIDASISGNTGYISFTAISKEVSGTEVLIDVVQ